MKTFTNSKDIEKSILVLCMHEWFQSGDTGDGIWIPIRKNNLKNKVYLKEKIMYNKNKC